jgi:hypothetical protein
MTALLTEATRQPRGAWSLRYPLATDQSYKLTKIESGDTGLVEPEARSVKGQHQYDRALGVGYEVESMRGSDRGVVWFPAIDPLVLPSYPF